MSQEQLQQKYFEYQMYEEHVKKLQEQYSQIDEQLLEIEYIKKAIDDLAHVKGGKDMMCPLSNGIFVKANIQKPEHFLVNVGENVICKKTPQQTKELMEKQKKEMESNREQIGEQLESIQKRMHELEQELSNLMQG